MLADNPFFHFLTLLLFKQKKKHIGAALISILIIALLGSVMFLSSSLRYTLQQTLDAQPDFVLTKMQSGKAVNTPLSLADEIMQIEGVTDVSPRVWGRYFYAPKENAFLVVGVDFFDVQSSKSLQTLLAGIDLKAFFAQDNMLVGQGVKAFLNAHYYTDSFSFKTPAGKFKKVGIYQTLPSSTDLMANDMVILPIETAREIFGLNEDEVTDIAFNVPNEAEWDTVMGKLYLLSYDLQVTDKRDMAKAYENLYNYKGGLFLILFIIVIVTFMLILYQRYTAVSVGERKEIGILRALGWSIKDILRLKFYETLSVVVASFVVGMSIAYGYVFVLGAPLLKAIFLGASNLDNAVSFVPHIEFGVLGSVFLFYAVPFFAAVLIPAWKIAVTSPKEAMQ